MLVVIAEKEELKLVEELGYGNEPILITGVGALNVIHALKDIPRETEIVNIGYCGSNYFEVGTKAIITAVATHHENVNFFERIGLCRVDNYELCDKTAECYTGTDFVENTKITEPCVFDMELAFIRALFPHTKAIKVVSDKLSLKQYKTEINKNKGENQ